MHVVEIHTSIVSHGIVHVKEKFMEVIVIIMIVMAMEL